MNESKRQKKVARAIQRELGDIFQKDVRHITGHAFITITEVGMTPDLGFARVYISMMMVENKQELIEKINHRKSEIRGKLGNGIGKQMRIVPDLEFFIDELQEEALRMDALIESLDIPPTEEDETEGNKD
ncbi:MAG: 30S ribosome-binding factor RbfA [Bacteroidetes bacterium]|nr:MAG: 30S ribosome-binding factor RbfA [Bacteroidota bacterium]